MIQGRAITGISLFKQRILEELHCITEKLHLYVCECGRQEAQAKKFRILLRSKVQIHTCELVSQEGMRPIEDLYPTA